MTIRAICQLASRLCIAATISVGVTSNASAADNAARPIYNPDGSFAFCLAEKSYADQRRLTVAMSPAAEINLGVSIPSGNFKVGSRYDLTLQLDQNSPLAVRAMGIDPESILMQFGKDPAFARQLMTAQKLTLGNGTKKQDFALTDTPAMLAALSQCNGENKGKTNATMAKVEQAMPEALKALLVAAGVQEIAPLTMDNIPAAERPADFVWKTGNLLGGVRERMLPKDKKLSDMIGIHLQGLKKQCNGKFKADLGKEEKINGLTLQPALVECSGNTQKTDKDIVVAILFYVTAANRFTIFAHETEPAHKGEALKVRDGIAAALRNLAQAMTKETAAKQP